ncbi:MAG: MBOAT family O-acyltransferase [Oscillospiraceae bacterium]
MVFSSVLFMFTFLPVVLLLYFILPKKFRNLTLFIVSLIFYAWGEPIYVVIMLFSTAVDYTHGIWVEKFLNEGKQKKAKLIVASSMIINLSLLCFFKYSDFLIGNINSLFDTAIPLLKLALPIGISFYTFQTMSYTVDVYRGSAKAQHNIIDFGAYVTLFPQLIAGPIVQYKTIQEQLTNRNETVSQFSYGVQRFMLGLGKKVLLANNIGMLWDSVKVLDIQNMPTLTAWIGIIAFTFQIYFDFSGYSDMAIGLGNMFGFKFLENFDHPYESKSITEFWRRWHISLGTWFREYVYIPLGGNRKGPLMQIRNIAIVWTLTGIWHGANWNFLMWGVYFGVILIIEKLFLLKKLEKAPAIVSHFYTVFLVICSWVIFAFENTSSIIPYFKAMFGLNHAGFANSNSMYLLMTNAILLIVLAIASTAYPQKIVNKLIKKFDEKPLLLTIAKNVVFVAIFIFSIAYLVDASYNPFMYLKF